MLWSLSVCLLLLLLFPLRLQLFLRHDRSALGTLEVGWLVFRVHLPFRISRTPGGGHQLTLLPRRPQEKPHTASSRQVQHSLVLTGAFLRADKAKRFLLRHLRLHLLCLDLHLWLQDAALLALLTGCLRSLLLLLPHRFHQRVQLRVQPDFFTGRSLWAFRCMVSIQPGILLITGGMLLVSWLLESLEHHPMSKEA